MPHSGRGRIPAAVKPRPHPCCGQVAGVSKLRPRDACIHAATKKSGATMLRLSRECIHARPDRESIQAEAESRVHPCCGQVAITSMSRPKCGCIHAATSSQMHPRCAFEQGQQEDAWSIPEPKRPNAKKALPCIPLPSFKIQLRPMKPQGMYSSTGHLERGRAHNVRIEGVR